MQNRWGIYEKALPQSEDWTDLLSAAAEAGFGFVEMSIDESDQRLARLDWSVSERRTIVDAVRAAEVPIDTLCLSAHRRFALGSMDEDVRARARSITRKAIELALDLGVRVIQIAGYDVYYEDSGRETRKRYLDGLHEAAELASIRGMMLGLENVDCPTVDSISKAKWYVDKLGSPWVKIYPDVGNLTAFGYEVSSEIHAGADSLVAVHLKDARPGEIRRVPYGSGDVDFPGSFRALQAVNFNGPYVVEMWNDADEDARATVRAARTWLESQYPSTS